MSKTVTLKQRLERVVSLSAEMKGRVPYVTVLLLASHRQDASVRTILESLTPMDLPMDAVLDIQVMVMPDASGSYGPMGPVIDAARAAPIQRQIRVLPAKPPFAGIHCLFPYGRNVHRGIMASSERLRQHEASTGRRFAHIIVRISGDVQITNPRIIAQLVAPLCRPEQDGVCISSAIQDSNWAADELPRRWLIKPVMEQLKACKDPLIPCPSSGTSGSMSAYLAPLFTELGISETWGGGEDGVGFSLLDPRIRAVVVRDASVYHCHAGRSLIDQWLSFGDWIYTGPINRLNRASAARAVDQTPAFDYFMKHGVITGASLHTVNRLRRLIGWLPAIHLVRLYHSLRTSGLMCMALLRGRR